MRSVPHGSFLRLTSPPALWQAWKAVRRGRRSQPAIAAFDLDADRHVLALHRALTASRYRPDPWRLRIIHDPKTRLIAAPSLRDRIVHRALVDEIGAIYERGFIDHTYAGVPGRGTHRAVIQYLAWMRRFGYRLHLDIARYFPSVSHPRLCALLFRRLGDVQTRDLVRRLLGAGAAVYRSPAARHVYGTDGLPDHGLPLGSYLSQWSGNLYLDGLDQYVKRMLKVPGYLRYMDDCVLFADASRALEDARERIAEWLAAERGLALNPKHRDVTPNTAPGVFLGYRVSTAGISPSRKLRRRLGPRVRLAARHGGDTLERTLVAYRGLLLF